MFGPNDTSAAPHPRRSAMACRAFSTTASVSALLGYAQRRLPLWCRRWSVIASATARGTWVPPGPSKYATGCPAWTRSSAGKAARISSRALIGPCSVGEGNTGDEPPRCHQMTGRCGRLERRRRRPRRTNDADGARRARRRRCARPRAGPRFAEDSCGLSCAMPADGAADEAADLNRAGTRNPRSARR